MLHNLELPEDNEKGAPHSMCVVRRTITTECGFSAVCDLLLSAGCVFTLPARPWQTRAADSQNVGMQYPCSAANNGSTHEQSCRFIVCGVCLFSMETGAACLFLLFREATYLSDTFAFGS